MNPPNFPFFPNLRYIQGMLGKFTSSRTHAPWRVILGVLCIALILVTGVVSVAHTHAQGASHADCSLCVVAHSAVQAASPAPQVLFLQIVTEVEVTRPLVRRQYVPQFALFSRPPPAA